MRSRFRLPSCSAVPDRRPSRVEGPPLLRSLQVGDPFPLGAAVLIPHRAEKGGVYAASLEAAAYAAVEMEPTATAHLREQPTGWSVGYAVGTLPAYQMDGSTAPVLIAATSWSTLCDVRLDLPGASAAASTSRADPSSDTQAFTVVAVPAVRLLGTLSAFYLRWHAEQRREREPSAACLRACVAAEADQEKNQAALITMLVSAYICDPSASVHGPPLTLYETTRSMDSQPDVVTCLRGVHVMRASDDTEVSTSFAPCSLSGPQTTLVCADACHAAMRSGLPIWKNLVARTDASWEALESALRCLSSVSSAVRAVQATVTTSQETGDEPARAHAITLRVVVDEAARATGTPSRSAALCDADMAPWQQYFAGLDGLFHAASQLADATPISTVTRDVENGALDAFCAAVAHPQVTPRLFWSCVLTAVREVATGDTAEGVATQACEVLRALAVQLWEAGVRRLTMQLNASLPPRTAAISPACSTSLIAVATPPDALVPGVLACLVRDDQQALLADSAVEGTAQAWRAALTTAARTELPSPSSLPTSATPLSPSKHPRCLTLAQTHRGTEQSASTPPERVHAIVRRLFHSPTSSDVPLFAAHVLASLLPLRAQHATHEHVDKRRLPLSGFVDIVYAIDPPPTEATTPARSTVSPPADMVEGLTRLYSTCPRLLFRFSDLVTEYLSAAAYGYGLTPTALDARPQAPSAASVPAMGRALSRRDRHGLDLHDPLQSLRASGRSREACQRCQELLPGCRLGLVLGASYAVLAPDTHAHLCAWALVGRTASALAVQRAGRAMQARRQLAAQRAAKAKAEGEALWRRWRTPVPLYWTELESRRTALLRGSEDAPLRRSLATLAQGQHDAWVGAVRDGCVQSLAILHSECAALTEALTRTVAAWVAARQAARAPIAGRLRAHEAACAELLASDRQRRAHRDAVRKDHARAETARRAAEAHVAVTRRATQEALAEAAREAALRRTARRHVEKQLMAQRTASRVRQERADVQHHVARQAQRFAQVSSRLTERRRVASTLARHSALPEPTLPHGTDDRDASVRALAWADHTNRSVTIAGSIAGEDGLVHSVLGRGPSCGASQWDLSRDLAALNQEFSGRLPL